MRALLLLALVPGCSLIYDGDAPDIPLLGAAPGTAGVARLNTQPVAYEYQVYGKDGAYWLAMIDQAEQSSSHLRVVRLSEPVVEQEWPTPFRAPIVTWRAFFILSSYDKDKKLPTELLIVQAGESPGETFLLPPGNPSISVGGSDDVFAVWIAEKETTSFDVYHRRGRTKRTVPIPVDAQGKLTIDPTHPSPIYFNGGATSFFMRDGVDAKTGLGHLKSYSTTDASGAKDIDFGIQPSGFGIGDKMVLTLGASGLRYVWFDRTKADQVIEPLPCRPDVLVYYDKYYYYFTEDSVLRRVPPDGSMPSELVPNDGLVRLLGFAPDGKLMYSKDPGNRYIYGAGDAWIDQWRFMERGSSESFSADGTRIRWLEHTAWEAGTGDLLSALVPGGAPLRLARNVRRYGEIGDGRILANANRAFPGVQNRIVVIDELRKNERWVAEAALDYQAIYGSTDLLVDVVTAASGHDVVRVPTPSMPCEDLATDVGAWLDGPAKTACKVDGDCTLLRMECGLPGSCAVASHYGPPLYTNRISALTGEWASARCAPACTPCPELKDLQKSQIAKCVSGACALVAK